MEHAAMNPNDILTVAVMLPVDEQEREAFYEHIASKGELHGARALSSAHGNIINYFNAHACLPGRPDLDACALIYKRLSDENAYQIASAVNQMKPQTQNQQRHAGAFMAYACMFILGFLTCMNLMPLTAHIV